MFYLYFFFNGHLIIIVIVLTSQSDHGHVEDLIAMSGKLKKRHKLHGSTLTDQILGTDHAGSNRSRKSQKKPKVDLSEETDYVSEKISKRVLDEARRQQDELEEEYGISAFPSSLKGKMTKLQKPLGEECGSDSESDNDAVGPLPSNSESCPVVTEEEEEAMKVFMSAKQPERRTLADVIMEKLREKETEIVSQMSDHPNAIASRMDGRVAAVFNGVGLILSKYRSGKLPKAFKVIPSLSNWEEALYLTEPDKWTAAAMWQATRIFASNLNSSRAQRFYNLVLLPRVRDDIAEYKRLNYHLYSALKKALYKPAAFFKGILLPLCDSGTCTLREALIISSILAKTSIPVLHSSAALLKIAEMEYSGANSIFMRTLFEKKYALPYRVIDAAVFHYVHFQQDPRNLPVLWHQSLLSFVQRYKEDISLEQKETLLELIRHKTHVGITPEIRREIVHSKCRDIGDTYMKKSQQQNDTMDT